jgi:glutamate N-acetyltransferase/amino-acid N-acetyltransferase
LIDLAPRKVDITINLNSGGHVATVVTNDLTHKYVEENSAYSS